MSQQKYQQLIRTHLDPFLDQLFAEFTGLHFHISWTPPPLHEWAALTLPTACPVRCRLSDSPPSEDCRTCGPRQLAHALSKNGAGHHFNCRRGMRNYWLAIQVRGEVLGIAYLQALDHALAHPPARKCAARAAQPDLPQPQPGGLSRINSPGPPAS